MTRYEKLLGAACTAGCAWIALNVLTAYLDGRF